MSETTTRAAALHCPRCCRPTQILPVGHRFTDLLYDVGEPYFAELYCELCELNWLVVGKPGISMTPSSTLTPPSADR